MIFDPDGTLYDRDALVRDVFTAQFDAYQDRFPGVSSGAFVSRAAELDAHGYREKAEVYAEIIGEWGLAAALAEELETDFWQRYLQPRAASPETLNTLTRLRDSGLALGLITNGSSRVQRAKLTSLGLSKYFDAILISEEEGVKKPDPVIFQRALDRCGVVAAEAVFVGDHPEADVRGARAAGMDAIWRRVPQWELHDPSVPTIDSLSGVLPLCFGEGGREDGSIR